MVLQKFQPVCKSEDGVWLVDFAGTWHIYIFTSFKTHNNPYR